MNAVTGWQSDAARKARLTWVGDVDIVGKDGLVNDAPLFLLARGRSVARPLSGLEHLFLGRVDALQGPSLTALAVRRLLGVLVPASTGVKHFVAPRAVDGSAVGLVEVLPDVCGLGQQDLLQEGMVGRAGMYFILWVFTHPGPMQALHLRSFIAFSRQTVGVRL